MPYAGQTYIVGKHLLAWAFVGALVILLVWFAWDFLILAFAGLLFAVLLVACTEWLEGHSSLSRRWAFACVVSVFVVAGVLVAWLFADRAVQEGEQMSEYIPKAITELRDYLDQTAWGHAVRELIQRGARNLRVEERFTALLSGVLDAGAGFVIVLAVGFFVALDFHGYKNGLLRLFPNHTRTTAQKALEHIHYVLRWWLIGQLVPMVVLGVATYIGLMLLQIPLAFALSLLTAILIFVPYIGALASEIPAVLVALMSGPAKALEVMLLYLGLHIAEAYILTPLVQKRAVRLPPVITILSQALMWTMAGVLGVALAAPIAATALTLVRTLYLKEGLEDRT